MREFIQLHRAILALSQPADVQLSLFPDFVCKGDELALDFEDGLSELVGREDEITAEQRAAVNSLDQMLTSMSAKGNSAVWTQEALRDDPKWEAVREKAKAVANAFGWELEAPRPSGAIYIPGA